MSKDNVKKMFGKIQTDSKLKNNYETIMQAHQKEAEKALSEKLIEFGKKAGFEFTDRDLLSARAELIDKVNSSNELSESDLKKVAGGFNVKETAIITSVTTFGLGCALNSIISEATVKNLCGKVLSVTEKCTDKY